MGESLKPTFFEVQKRPLGTLPKAQLTPSPITDIPRGSVRDRINFYEKLKEELQMSSLPPGRQTADAVLTGNKLSEFLYLTADKGGILEASEPPTREVKSDALGPPARLSLESMSPTYEPAADLVPVAVFPSPVEAQQPSYEFTLSKANGSDMELKSHSSLSASTAEPIRSEAINKEKDIDAICVNCLEYITLTEVDDHSLMCFNPAYGHMDCKDEIALRIKKLHRAINRRIKTAREAKLMTLMRLREIAVEVTKDRDANIASIEMELDDIAASSLTIDGGICCSILARRLANLLGELEMEEQSTDGVFNYYNAEAERQKQKQKLLRWKSHAQTAEEAQSPQRRIDEVKSDLGSDMGSAVSVGSRLSEVVNESDVADLQSAEEGLKQVSEEQLKKYFYSMCLKRKLLMPKTHPGQRVLVSGLFKEARKMDLSVSMWDKFIAERLEAQSTGNFQC